MFIETLPITKPFFKPICSHIHPHFLSSTLSRGCAPLCSWPACLLLAFLVSSHLLRGSAPGVALHSPCHAPRMRMHSSSCPLSPCCTAFLLSPNASPALLCLAGLLILQSLTFCWRPMTCMHPFPGKVQGAPSGPVTPECLGFVPLSHQPRPADPCSCGFLLTTRVKYALILTLVLSSPLAWKVPKSKDFLCVFRAISTMSGHTNTSVDVGGGYQVSSSFTFCHCRNTNKPTLSC